MFVGCLFHIYQNELASFDHRSWDVYQNARPKSSIKVVILDGKNVTTSLALPPPAEGYADRSGPRLIARLCTVGTSITGASTSVSRIALGLMALHHGWWPWLVNVPMFHITHTIGDIISDIYLFWWWKQNPQKGTSIPTPGDGHDFSSAAMSQICG